MNAATLAEIHKIIESLSWMSRRQVLDTPMARLMLAWESRFDLQGRRLIRRGLPFLRSLYEAKHANDDRITKALVVLDTFKYPPADTAYEVGVKVAFDGGGAQAAADIGGSFLSNDAAVLNYLKGYSASQLGADVDLATKAKVRATLVRSFEEHWSYNKTIKEVRNLFDGFRARAKQGYIRNRAELIAVTELGNAYSAGSMYSARILAMEGHKVEKAWAITSDPCPTCEPNAAQGWIPLEKEFSSGHMAPTAHPACRCSLLTRSVV